MLSLKTALVWRGFRSSCARQDALCFARSRRAELKRPWLPSTFDLTRPPSRAQDEHGAGVPLSPAPGSLARRPRHHTGWSLQAAGNLWLSVAGLAGPYAWPRRTMAPEEPSGPHVWRSILPPHRVWCDPTPRSPLSPLLSLAAQGGITDLGTGCGTIRRGAAWWRTRHAGSGQWRCGVQRGCRTRRGGGRSVWCRVRTPPTGGHSPVWPR